MTSELLSNEYATMLAAAWARLQEKHAELDATFRESTGRSPDDVKRILRQIMELDNLTEIIDPETGKGVKLGKPRRQTQWDTLGMEESVLLALKDLGLVDIRTTAFDRFERDQGSIATLEAKKWRIDGESAAPFTAVTE